MEHRTPLWVIGAIGMYIFFSSDSEKKPSPQPQTYTPAMVYPTRGATYHGCTDDCSGHQAGYDWAQLHGVTDPAECDGDSQSFIEGCQEYAETQLDENAG